MTWRARDGWSSEGRRTSMRRRRLHVLAVLLLPVIMAACGSVKPLAIQAVWGPGRQAASASDATLLAEVRETVLRTTGVECTWTSMPDYPSTDQYLQETLGTGALPQ